MTAHVLLNVVNELGKSDKMQGLPNIVSLFCNKLDKFSNTGTQMFYVDSFYHMTSKLF